jgi:3-oxoacyl-[acyl-carrier protein] reductase
MDLQLKGKIAAVAASSQGLGFAAARALAAEGAKVGICSRSRDNIESAASRLHDDTGAEVFPWVGDLSNRDEATGFVEAVAAHFKGLHVLVTNAGGPPPGGFEQAGFEELERAFHLTMESTIAMIKSAVPHMRRQKWGRIVNILSITVKQPETNLLTSNTMRAGLVGYAKSVSQELAAENILINNVAPGYTRTERLDELAESLAKKDKVMVDEIFARWQGNIPMGRLGRPEELAAVVTFLASEPASYVTGVTLQVDGGFVQGLL